MNLMNFVSGCLIAMLLSACHPSSEFEITSDTFKNLPDTVLEVDKMIDIMTDIHLAEAWVIEDNNDTISKNAQLASYYEEIFLNHQITSDHYKRSYNFYADRPYMMNYIYQRITEKLNLMESENRKLIAPKKTNEVNEQSNK